MSLRVYIVDDHPIFRLGLSELLRVNGVRVCGEADSVEAALEGLDDAQADIVIVDLNLADGSGIRLLKALGSRPGSPPALVVSMHDESIYARRALEAGALGYVSKTEVSQQIIGALRRVSRGRIAVSDRVRQSRFQSNGGRAEKERWIGRLSNRELEVFRLVGRAVSTQGIADTLRLSVKTVESHQAKIKAKLGIRTMAELIRIAAISDHG